MGSGAVVHTEKYASLCLMSGQWIYKDCTKIFWCPWIELIRSPAKQITLVSRSQAEPMAHADFQRSQLCPQIRQSRIEKSHGVVALNDWYSVCGSDEIEIYRSFKNGAENLIRLKGILCLKKTVTEMFENVRHIRFKHGGDEEKNCYKSKADAVAIIKYAMQSINLYDGVAVAAHNTAIAKCVQCAKCMRLARAQCQWI